MRAGLEFTPQNYRERTGMGITADAVIAIKRSFDSLVDLNRLRRDRFRGTRNIALDDAEVGAEHLWVGLSRDTTTGLYLQELGMDTAKITNAIDSYRAPIGSNGRPIIYLLDRGQDGAFKGFKSSADNALVRASEEAIQLKAREVDTGHLLLATLFDPSPPFKQTVAGMGVGVDKVKEHIFARMTGVKSPFEGQAEYVAEHSRGEIPLSIHYIAAYIRDKNSDAKLRQELIDGLDRVAKRIDSTDPRK